MGPRGSEPTTAATPGPPPLRARLRSAPGIYVFTVLFLLIYAAWHLFPSLPLAQSDLATIVQAPLGLIAACFAWGASRRTRASVRVCRAWLLIGLAVACQGGGAVVEAGAEVLGYELAYPSVADALYLSFYPLMLAGVLWFPTLRRTARQTLQLTLDCAIVGLGGGAAFAYLVVGPDLLVGSSPLEAAVTLAYPVADTILIVALAAAVLGSPAGPVRAGLRWLTAAICLLILGDLFWGYSVLHESYGAESALNIAYELSIAGFIIAATRQRPVSVERPGRATEDGRNAWLPYLAIATVLAIFSMVQSGEKFFPDVLISMITAAVLVFVLGRQLVSLHDLRHSRRRLAEAQEIAQLGSWEVDLDGDRVEFSAEGARLLGIGANLSLTLAEFEEMVEPDDRGAALARIQATKEDGRASVVEARLRRADGELRSFLGRIDVERTEEVLTGFRGTIQDVTDRKRMEAQLEYQADHDPLTGLYNRRRFGEELERALRVVSRYRRSGAVLMIDIDNFKTINDTHGHAAGDRVLKGVAAAVAARTRETDVFARLGGDELAIVLPEAGVDDARRVAEEIRESAAAVEGAPKLSIGIAPFDADSRLVADDLLVAADMALYEAKNEGRDRVVVYDGTANGAISWVEKIRSALLEDRFVLHGQPMIDLESGEVKHHELLIRMLDESGEVIPPDAFLPTAERIGLITEIDRWVTAAGLRLAREGWRLSINLAGPSIGDAEILEMVRSADRRGRRCPRT